MFVLVPAVRGRVCKTRRIAERGHLSSQLIGLQNAPFWVRPPADAEVSFAAPIGGYVRGQVSALSAGQDLGSTTDRVAHPA